MDLVALAAAENKMRGLAVGPTISIPFSLVIVSIVCFLGRSVRIFTEDGFVGGEKYLLLLFAIVVDATALVATTSYCVGRRRATKVTAGE